MLLIVQIIMLTGVLVFIVLFRKAIADGAGKAFGAFGSSDLKVKHAPADVDAGDDVGKSITP